MIVRELGDEHRKVCTVKPQIFNKMLQLDLFC